MADTFAVNACFVRHGRVGGAEQAAVNLIEGLRHRAVADETWTVYDRERLVTRAALEPVVERTLPDPVRMNRMAYEALALPFVARPSAWLHLNYATPPALRAPSVTVIHDAQYAHFPENFSPIKRAWLARAHARTARRAEAVVAISEFTAADLVRLHGDDLAKRITVIPNAVSFDRLDAGVSTGTPPTTRPYVLSVAAPYRHKNVSTLVEAHRSIAERYEIDLVLVGQAPEVMVGRGSALRERPTGPGVIYTGFVSDERLGELYRNAALFVFPSLFEGFGLPVVEALGLGVPTITTRCGSIPEVGSDLPVYVDDPTSVTELAAVIAAVIDDPASVRPGVERIARLRERYAPPTVAGRYADLLREVAG